MVSGSRLNQKLTFPHDRLVVEEDVEALADDIYVRGARPGGAGVFAVGVAEGDVDAGEFFVLQDVAYHAA